MSIVNLAAYHFATIEDTAAWRPHVTERCNALGLRGTILLAPEGINLFVAGAREDTDAFIQYIRHDPLFEGKFASLQFKESLSEKQPFTRMLVKLKREIITMKKPAIRPELGRAPFVDAPTLKAWLDRGHDDEGRPVVMLDTRNAFEVDVGTFDNALDYRITKFSEFPEVIEQNRADLEGKTVVSFCTGGIRCEKAAIHMKEVGIEHVYQLEGGILKYFEEVGGAHYHGDCFVFDYRTALNRNSSPPRPRNALAAARWSRPKRRSRRCTCLARRVRHVIRTARRLALPERRCLPTHELSRTLRALAHRPAAFRLAGECARKLARRPGSSRRVAGSH